MPTESYYLPCACGVRSIVDASQCGRKLTCQCGQVLEVPPLRGLRQLAKADLRQVKPSGRAWNPARGLALVALVPLMGALAFGAWVYQHAPPPPPKYPSLEGRTPQDIFYNDWFHLVDRGIDDSFMPVIEQYIVAVNRRRDLLTGAGVVAGLSALGVIAGLAWPAPRGADLSRPATKPRPTTPQRPAV